MLSSSSTIPSPFHKHIVPTHLNLPDQVLTLWSFGLTARQLLLLLVGGGISGDLWHALAFLSHDTAAGQCVRVMLALLPVLLVRFAAGDGKDADGGGEYEDARPHGRAQW